MTEPAMPSHHGVDVSPEDRTYPNETIRLLLERASCRSFSDKKIPPDVMQLVLEAGVHAAGEAVELGAARGEGAMPLPPLEYCQGRLERGLSLGPAGLWRIHGCAG